MSTKIPVSCAFEPTPIEIALDNILPSKPLPDALSKNAKYQQIRSSIQEVGLVEPPVVARVRRSKDKWLLLDGHLRVRALKGLSHTTVLCLVATEEEAFTYNKRVNRLATIQEHKMILRAVERGVSPERIAAALNVNVGSIRQKYRLLDGICAEVEDLLKDRICPINTFEALKRMRPLRQIEAAQLMIAADNFSVPYAQALLASSFRGQRLDEQKPKPRRPASTQIPKLEQEVTTLQSEVKAVEQAYARDQLTLVLARAYISSLINNENVAGFLSKHHPEIAAQFEEIAAAPGSPNV